MKHLTFIFAAGAALVASACGQKGPLYLPERSGTVITRPAGATGEQPTGTAPQPAPQNQPQTQPPQSAQPNQSATQPTQPATPQGQTNTPPKRPNKNNNSQPPQ